MEKIMAGVGIFCGTFLMLFLVLLFSGGAFELVYIAGVCLVTAMLGVVLMNQHQESTARKRAEKRRIQNMNQSLQAEQKAASPP